MNNADLIVRALRDAGATHVFGIPSGNVLPLLEAARAGGLEFVLMAHEGSAGFAAEVTARLTGRPGFCFATMGPGATNLTTGVGCAYLDRSPVVAVTCTVPTYQLGRRVQMAIDHHALFRPVTKATYPLRDGLVAASLREAVVVALSEPPGPVHLDLPEDVSLADAGDVSPLVLEGVKLPPPRRPIWTASGRCCAPRVVRWPSSARQRGDCATRRCCGHSSNTTSCRSPRRRWPRG